MEFLLLFMIITAIIIITEICFKKKKLNYSGVLLSPVELNCIISQAVLEQAYN